MRFLEKKLAGCPTTVRVAPFLIFLALTVAQGEFGPTSAYWFYLGKTLAGVWLVWTMRPLISEMRWAFSWEAALVGVGVFAIWVGLDQFYPHLLKSHSAWNPHDQFGQDSALAWLMIVVRLLGSTFVVPPLEEVFYRSFLYRYLVNPHFLSVPLNKFSLWPFLTTAAVFGLSHNEWLAGILCGVAYQWLVIRKNRLGDAMTAHAITNFLLGLWVVTRGAWHFW